MKLTFIFTLFTLSEIVKCNLIAAMARPVILSIGTIFAAMNQDVVEIQPLEWSNLMPYARKKAGMKDKNTKKDELR